MDKLGVPDDQDVSLILMPSCTIPNGFTIYKVPTRLVESFVKYLPTEEETNA